MTKSYVTLEQKVCPACGATHDTGSILMDTRLRDKFDHKTATGWAPCPDCRSMIEQGYVVMVAIDETKSEEMDNGNVGPSGAHRLGPIAFLAKAAFAHMFDAPAPPGGVAFCDQAVIDHLTKLKDEAEVTQMGNANGGDDG